MSLDERDYMRNRNQDSPPGKRGVGQKSGPRCNKNYARERKLKTTLVWLLVLWGGYYFFKYTPDPPRPVAAFTQAPQPQSAVSFPVQPRPMVSALEVDDGFSVALHQAPDGHYHIAGTVNGFPVVYLVDTGASLTSIPERTAHNAGIQSCTHRMFNTANGPANGCVATVAEITFGKFKMSDIEVAIMPEMKDEALLGMNALSQVQMAQQSDMLRLSAP